MGKTLSQKPRTSRNKTPRPNRSKDPTLGIPRVLRTIRFEKCMVVLPVRVQPTLAAYIRQRGGSTWIRKAILEKLRRRSEG